MLHRPADSRLLSNLLSHERDYVRALHSQLDYGQASLSSFSAYAAASPPPASHAIGSVATSLVGAHDALRGYVLAVEEWCEQLKMLKEMEDEVGTIARDREILVDRLIKASKSNNPKRRSIFPSSTNNEQGSAGYSASHSTLEHLNFSNSKLNLAQNELQACETHLTEKERILAQMRESALVGGLKARCKALAECGWKWSELGKSGLKALDTSVPRGSFDQPGFLSQKPLPGIHSPYQQPSSDVSSSLGPSESASQIFHPYHPNSPRTNTTMTHSAVPEADIRDESHFALSIPPAHAISEEDHYTPPQMRGPERPPVEDEPGGSSAEEGTDERQYEVHENPLFSSKAQSKKPDSKTRLPLKRSKRQNSDSGTVMPTSVSAPVPLTGAGQRKKDQFGTSSSTNTYSDSQQGSPRRRKRSTFLGLGALTGIFHKRDHSGSKSADDLNHSPSSPKKGEKWYSRTDRNLKKAHKGDDSSDDEVDRPPAQTDAIPPYLAHFADSRSKIEEKEPPQSRPKRAPSTGRKLRKASDSDRGPEIAEGRKANMSAIKGGNVERPQVQAFPNWNAASASVSRSSTILSQSTVKSSSSTAHASFDPSPHLNGRRASVVSDSGHAGPAKAKAHRRRTSLGHVSSPPTNGQMSLLSIVEDVSLRNRQNWLHSNPNNLLIEVKAPKSVYESDELHNSAPATPIKQANSDDTPMRPGGRNTSPLRQQALTNYQRNSLSASSSEPSLPLKHLPATPSPLRSALRNRSVSPSTATMSPVRPSSPAANKKRELPNGHAAPIRPTAPRNDTGASSVKDSDTASLSSAYETGHEELDSSPPTPRAEEVPSIPNGHALEAAVNGSQLSASTGGTATPPSRRKSVRVSLKPTFSPTPPPFADDEEDHTPWAPEPASNGWATRHPAENAVWDDSSEEDEEYTRAKKMLLRASRKLDKVSKAG